MTTRNGDRIAIIYRSGLATVSAIVATSPVDGVLQTLMLYERIAAQKQSSTATPRYAED